MMSEILRKIRRLLFSQMGATRKMNGENKIDQETSPEYPGIVVRNIVFNDGTSLSPSSNSIIVFTGANNCGKSQVLRDIENCFDESAKRLSIVIDDLKYELRGEISRSFLEKNYHLNQHGYLEQYGSSSTTSEESLVYDWSRKRLSSDLRRLLIKRISTESRLTESNSLTRDVYGAAAHPIHKMMKSEELAETISDYFQQAFGEELVVNRNALRTIPLHVGKVPNKADYTLKELDKYNAIIESLPQLQDQGDGMRSFASILLDTFTSEYSLSLIDEPEAFLHPPQARILGKMLGRSNPRNRQLFVSTHSEDFLQGILDASNENVTIVRINRQGDKNKMSVLNNDEIEKLWTNPLLRYSNILGGLFHEMVIVCESDYDCLFYQAVMNAIYESEGEVAPDVLFTHCGGKSRAKDVVRALRAVNVPVISICDFDLLNSSQYLRPLIEAFGIDWETINSAGMKTVYDSINAKQASGVDMRTLLKSIGKVGLEGDAPAAYEEVEKICRKAGLYIVPYGEMECFDKTVGKEKKDWVYYVLENYDLATEPKMQAARSFVRAAIDCGLAA